jgi:hypothetical protein
VRAGLRAAVLLRAWLLLTLLASGVTGPAQTVRIGVFSLFHATRLLILPAGSPVLIAAEGRPALMVTGERSSRAAAIRLEGEAMWLGEERVSSIRASARDGGETNFILVIPGKIQRQYRGVLTVSADDRQLVPVVQMKMETAVASIVSAESVPGAGLEALKAQAVAARSYLAAGGRHRYYDFCDSTHCQFLRSPPVIGSAADRAAQETRGLVLTWRGQILAAMYSSRCGGRTLSLRQSGMAPNGYPYFSVVCAWCRRHPLPVTRSADDPAPRKAEMNGGHGHALGLCQHGAAGMAESGATFSAILRYYYPETELEADPSMR